MDMVEMGFIAEKNSMVWTKSTAEISREVVPVLKVKSPYIDSITHVVNFPLWIKRALDSSDQNSFTLEVRVFTC